MARPCFVKRLWPILVWVLVGCSAPPDATSGSSGDSSPTAKAPVESPVDTAYVSAPDAGEWLMNAQHTLRGLSMEAATSLLGELLKAGAVQIRVGEVQPDPNDPSFLSAGKLLIETPSNDAKRSSLFAYIANQWVTTPPIADQGQRHIELPMR